MLMSVFSLLAISFSMFEHSLVGLLVLLMLVLLALLGPHYVISSLSLGVDLFNLSLIFMSVVCFLGVFLSLNESLTGTKNKMYFFLVFFSLMMMISNNFIFLYMWFEVSLIPIFMLIIYEGYQPERFKAGIYMVVYTLVASLPLLFLFIVYVFYWGVPVFEKSPLPLFKSGTASSLIVLVWLVAFLVKFPMYGVHFWLPLAHVQAPTGGSMILAAILLKLGGVGLLKAMSYIDMGNSLVLGLGSWSLLGGATASLLCMLSQEMKVLVALSSVAHMSLAISVIMSGLKLGFVSYLLVLISHGYSSASMFLFVGVVYTQVGYRSMVTFFNMSGFFPVLLFWALLSVLANMGLPPTLNFMAEMSGALLLFNLSNFYVVVVGLSLLLAVLFSVLLYSQVFLGADFRSGYFLDQMGVSVLYNSSFLIFSAMFFLSLLLFMSMW